MGVSRTSHHLRAAWLVIGLLSAAPAAAQLPGASQPSPAGTPAAPVRPADAMGRESPRGAVLGFMEAQRRGDNQDLGVLYLDTRKKGDAARELARQLYVVLDSRLPARLPELSDRPEGSLTNPFKPNQDVIGTIETSNGPLDIIGVLE